MILKTIVVLTILLSIGMILKLHLESTENMKSSMLVRRNMQSKKRTILFEFICLFLLFSGCNKKDALDNFVQTFSNDNRTNSIILPTSVYGGNEKYKIDNIKINFHDETDPNNIKAEACKGVDVESDLAVYRSELAKMKTSYIDLLKSLSHEEMNEPNQDDTHVLMMLESKYEAETIIFVLYDNNSFLINDGSNKTFYNIDEANVTNFVEVYEQFFDYYLHDSPPCWAKDFLPLLEKN